MFNQPRAVIVQFSRLGLAFVLIATLIFVMATPQAATGSTDIGHPGTTIMPDAASTFDPIQLPLSFVENAGQVDAEVIFQANGLGSTLFFSQNNVILMLPGSDDHYVVNLDFVGENADINVVGANQLPGIVNYFMGNNPDDWLTNIPTYEGLNYENLYPGIDLNYVGTQGILKSTYSVTAGANASVIAWRYGSAIDTRIDAATGDLHIVLDNIPGVGEIILVERAPVAWQTIDGDRVPVDVSYTIDDTQTVRFELGDYDPAYALTLDPELLYSSFFGGGDHDIGYAITSDTKGNVYITGETTSPNLPKVPASTPDGVNKWQGSKDVFVTKINVAISSQQVVYSSYLGGSGDESGYGIAIDELNNAYVTGQTKSVNFPTYPLKKDGYQNGTVQGVSDAFVVKFNASGSALLYSTYLGGKGNESGNAIDVDSSGNAYVTGWTTYNSTGKFPTANAFQSNPGSFLPGSQDAFVTKLNAAGTGLVYSTYLGGSGTDVGDGIEVFTNPGGDYAYVVGQAGTGFPMANAYDNGLGGSTDAFLTRFEANGSSLVFSTYIGGTGNEAATDLVIDPSGNVYVTGWTDSNTTFPITSDAKQALGRALEDAFIVKFPATGSPLLYGTYFGGDGSDKAYAIDLDIEGIIHFAGETSSDEDSFPLEGPFEDRSPTPTWDQLTLEVPPDAFVAGFDPLDTTPGKYLYSSYLGGMGNDAKDIAWGLVVDVAGGVNVVGETASDDFPQVRDAFQRGGFTDAFIAFMSSAKADLIIAKKAPKFVSPGGPLDYVIEVGNLGPNDAYGVQIEDPLPMGYVDYLGVTTPPGTTCSYDSGKVTCDITKVRAPSFGDPTPAPVSITIHTHVKSGITGSFKNVVEITQSNTFDPNPSLDPEDENANAAEHIAFAVPDLVLELTADDYRVNSEDPGQIFTYTISIRNDSEVTANDVVIEGIELPPHVQYISHSAPVPSTFDLGTGVWDLNGNLPKNFGTISMTITVQVIVDTPYGTFLPLSGTAVAPAQDDANLDDNSDTVRVKVVSPFGDSGCHPSPDDPNEVLCLTD